MNRNTTLFVAGLSYRTAPVEVRERLAVAPSMVPCCGCRLQTGANLSEVVVLSTCNRVEIYGVAMRQAGNRDRLLRWLPVPDDQYQPYIYFHEGPDAVKHLFGVASGLDSMVLGETEITGQVKQAYQAAQDMKLSGRVTNRLFQTALQTAKTIRTRTQIGRGATSVGSVAVELAGTIFGPGHAQSAVLIIGAGQMGEACVKHLAKKGARSVLVANRSLARAEALAQAVGGRAVPYEERLQAMAQADIVVASTGSPQVILSRADIESVMVARRNRPLFLIDIAVPRNIDPAAQHLDDVYLYDIDDLEAVVRENVRTREQELAKCRVLIEESARSFMDRMSADEDRRSARGDKADRDWDLSGALTCNSGGLAQ